MKDEPSLLDYLKSLIDPRRERLQIPGLDATAASDTEDNLSQDETAPVKDTPADPSRAQPSQTPSEPSETAAIDAVEPELAGLEPAPRGPLPWRTLAMLVLALAAQGALAPPDRSVNMGVFLYFVSFVMGIWAMRVDELPFPRLPRRSYRMDRMQVGKTFLWAAVPATLFAFAVLGGNKFTAFNLSAWLLSLGLVVGGLYVRSGFLRKAWGRARELAAPPYRFSITSWGLIFTAGILLILFFRFYQLEQVPSQMFSDHAEKLQDVQDILNGETRIFFPRNTGREFVQMYLTAFTADILGYGLTFMALKMGTALAGLVTFPFIYLLGAEIANRRVGFLAMVMAGMSYWLNVITRVALRFALYPLFVAPTLYFLVRGLRRGNRNDFIWAGLFLGLGLHGYSPFRFVPLLVLVAVGLFILHVRSRVKRNQAVWHLLVVIAVSLVVFLPLLRFMVESDANRSLVLYRSLSRISNIETAYPGDPLDIFLQNMGRSLAMFAWENGNTWVHSVPLRPALDIVSGALFYAGYILVAYRYVRQRNWEDGLLLLSVPLLLLPSVMSLAFPDENPSLNRSGGALVPVFLIAAMPLDGLGMAVRRWAGLKWGRLAAISLVGFLLLWSALSNFDLVFRQYSGQFALSSWNTTELGSVVRGFADSIGSEDTAWVVPWPHWVDTRLVGINAGVYIRDYALPRAQLSQTVLVPGPKLFLFHPQDNETQMELERLYPGGDLHLFESELPGKDFMIFVTPGE